MKRIITEKNESRKINLSLAWLSIYTVWQKGLAELGVIDAGSL
jgi:hypothetical protein